MSHRDAINKKKDRNFINMGSQSPIFDFYARFALFYAI